MQQQLTQVQVARIQAAIKAARAQVYAEVPANYKASCSAYYTVKAVNDHYEPSVTFHRVLDEENLPVPGVMLVRSRNWSYEDEPNGLMNLTDARALYKELATLGATPF